jgi:hypothetical protein
MAGDGVRGLLQVAAAWFGLGDPPADGGTRLRPTYLFVQTAAAVALGAVAAVVYIVVEGTSVPTDWAVPYLPLFGPLAIAVARRPGTALWPLAAAVPAGGLVTVVVLTMVPGTTFWPWFSAVSAGALAAGTLFGALSPRD